MPREKRIKAAVGIAVGLLAAGAALAQAQPDLSPEQLFERLAPSVWTVETYDAKGQRVAGGSGVVVSKGSVITNCHVLVKSSRVTLTHENVIYGATLEHSDPERDLCLLKVANFNAPAVAVASYEGLRIGSRVYAIGSPRGLEQTISDGLLSGLRKLPDGGVHLQVTVPISPGSSGGGLFDAQGRLIGITTFLLRNSQNLNFAVPATWIAEVAQRAQSAGQGRRATAAPGRSYQYRVTDRVTRRSQEVTYYLDRVEDDKLLFNGGTRVESRSGEVLKAGDLGGGEADASMPPGGWWRPGAALGSTWNLKYTAPNESRVTRLDLQARVVAEPVLRVADREVQTSQLEFTGWIDRSLSMPGSASGRYRATAWFAPELGRLVRFEVQARGGFSGGQFIIDEVLELVLIR